MKGSNLFYIAVTATVLFSCSVVSSGGSRRVTGDPVMQAAKEYPKSERATFLYTEGLKNNLMYGDPVRSALLFSEALKLDSLHAPTYYELANLFSKTPHKAIPYSRTALRLDSTNTWYLSQLGQLYLGTKEYDSALRVYNKLLNLAPSNPDNYARLAALYEQQGQPFSAISVLDTAEARFGIIEGVSDYKRQLLIGVKLYDKALREAKEMTENFPYDASNFLSLAETYAAIGRDSLALEAYEQARTLSPNNTEVLISLNDFYKRRGDDVNFLSSARQLFDADDIPLESKIDFFEEITSSRDFYRAYFFQISNLISDLAIKNPNDFRVTQLYGNHLISSGNLEGALQLYKSHTTDSIPQREVFSEILDMESYLKHPDSVAKYTSMALEKFPEDPEFYLRKGFGMFYFMEDYAGAEREFLKALKLSQTDSLKSVIYGTLGDNRQKMGGGPTVYSFYRKGLKYDPDNSVILNNYSYYLSEKGEKLALADKMSQKACSLSPNNATYIDTRAWVLFKLGQYEEAKTLMQQALALDQSGSDELFLHYGDILYALKDNFMAVFYWEKARENGFDSEEIDKRIKQVETK